MTSKWNGSIANMSVQAPMHDRPAAASGVQCVEEISPSRECVARYFWLVALMLYCILVATRAQGQTISTVAGNGSYGYNGDGISATAAELNYPGGVALDSSGNIYIAYTDNNRLRKVSAGTITALAGNGNFGYSGDGGAATSAEISFPEGVDVDCSCNVYIADSGNNRIRKVSGGTITTVVGNGTAGYRGDGGSTTTAEISYPEAVAVDCSGNIYIADTGNNHIRKVTSGIISTVAGNGSSNYSGQRDGAMVCAAMRALNVL